MIATDVHHITDLGKGGNPWASENLAALCRSCHAKITKARMD